MKILKLKFKNIHSLKGENEIDFTKSPLADVGIFAITGSTGSGKSTLLDIITLALYSRTPRMGLLSKSSVSNFGSIITRNTTDCYAEIEYEVLSVKYRSRWSISYARTGNLRDYEMELANISKDEIIEAHKKSLIPDLNSKIIGLNYDQFVKSIVLSQGEFAKFLQAKPDERGDLLEKITGTEIYRQIGQAAFNRKKEEEDKLLSIKIVLDSIDLIEENTVKELVANKTQNEKDVLNLDKNILEWNKLFQIKQKIIDLEKQKNEFLKKQQQIENEFYTNKNDFIKLYKHEKLIDLKTDIYELKNLYKTIGNLQYKYKTTENEIDNLQKNKNKSNLQLEDYVEIKNKLSDEQKILEPIIKQVRLLETEKQSKNDLILELRKKFDTQVKDYKASETLLAKVEAEIKNAKSEKENLENWITNNLILIDLDKDLFVLKDKVKNYINFTQNFKTLISKNKFAQKYKNDKWSNNLNDCKLEIEKSNYLIAEISGKLDYKEQNIPSLTEEKDLLGADYNVIKDKIDLSKRYKLASEKLVEYENEESQFEIDLEKNIIKKSNTQNELEIIEFKVVEFKARNERQQLENKYKDDRLKLKQDEKCFLCGSTNHPFVKNYVSELEQSKKDLQNIENQQKQLLKEFQKIDINITKTQTEIKLLIKNIEQKKLEIFNYKIKFKENNKWNIEISNIKQIETYKDAIIIDGKKIAKQLKLLNSLISEKNKKREFDNLFEKITNIVEAKSNIDNSLEKYSLFYDENIDVNLTLKKLSEISVKFINATAQNEILKNEISINLKLEEEKMNVLAKLKSELEEQKEKLDLVKLEKDKINAEIINLLPNKTPEQAEKELQRKIKSNENQISESKINIAKIESNLASNSHNKSETENEISRKIIKRKTSEQKLLPIFKNQGYQTVDEAASNILQAKEVDKIKSKKEELNNSKISINQSIKDKNEDIEKSKINDNSEIEFFDLDQQIEVAKKTRQEKNRTIGNVENKLSENNIKKLKLKDLSEKYEQQNKEFIRWNTLNELIGDSQGKKFSRFAQELTLMELIGLSNRHLTKLNKRYLLKKSENLLKDNLIVIDRFIANSERSVQTLSGGETFLLSLSLALGLSDLASKNTKIESLFIDEGFGTLDQETLDKSLETLENLQTQTNRTIGIISHVQAIKERITTQIELIKVSSGGSQIVIKN